MKLLALRAEALFSGCLGCLGCLVGLLERSKSVQFQDAIDTLAAPACVGLSGREW